MDSRCNVYKAIDGERKYQDSTWEPGDKPQSVGEELLLIQKLLNDAMIEWANEPSPEIKTLSTIRKIASVAVRCMEYNGVVFRYNKS